MAVLKPAKNFTFLLLLLLVCQWASGDVVYLADQTPPVLRVEGEIQKQDLKDFQSALAQLKRSGKKLHMNAVQLNSGGGKGHAGMEMGRLIRRARLNTFVAPESECISACVDVLIGGVVRMAFGSIKVHRASLLKGNFTRQQLTIFLPRVDAKAAAYIKEMGISSLLTESISQTPTWALHNLTRLEKLQWGLHGMERVFEEGIFRKHARELKISADEFADLYAEHFTECDVVASKFEMTAHECVKQKTRIAVSTAKK